MLCKNLRLAALVVVASVCGIRGAPSDRPDDIHPRCWALRPLIDTLQDEVYEGMICNGNARLALRLAFHDAISWSKVNPSAYAPPFLALGRSS
jgi:hypothetical protein